MKNPVSEVAKRSHGTMELMTTPESPRNQWPARKVRLDDQTWKAARQRLLDDEESWQSVAELLTHAWLANLVDVKELRATLKARGLLVE